MKTVIVKIAPFLALFIVLNLLIINFSGFYKQRNEYTERIDESINNQSEIIFLGDSHSESIKLLDLNNNIGNLAYGADGINEMYLKILIMLEKNKNLEQVFITVEPQIFNTSVSPNSTFLNSYLIDLEDPLDINDKSKLDLLIEQVPLFNDNYILYVLNKWYGVLKPKLLKKDKLWSDYTSTEQQRMAIKMGQIDHRGIMTRERDLEVFKEIVRLCKKNNIKLVGTLFPVNKNYIDQAQPEDIQKVNEFVKAQHFDKVLDYTNDFNDQRYFLDCDHLNKEGMTILASYINRDSGINILK